MADYSIYVTIHNATGGALDWAEPEVPTPIYGEWAAGQPPKSLKDGAKEELNLKARTAVKEETGGWVRYANKKSAFTVEFANPKWDLTPIIIVAASEVPDAFNFDITYQQKEKGKPLRGTIKVSLGESGADMRETGSALTRLPNTCGSYALGCHGSFQANFKIYFGPGKAVHELITMAALFEHGLLPVGTKYDNLTFDQWEYLRGLCWNDDPSCFLFFNVPRNNHSFGAGVDFMNAYLYGAVNSMTQRSHFGDLQGLHSMANLPNETAQASRDRLLRLFEAFYKLAKDDIPHTSLLADVLPHDFGNGQADPDGAKTLGQLLLGSTPAYRNPLYQRRALGACLHIIQDSYALGHTRRKLLNPEDLGPRTGWPNNYLTFQDGKFGQWGNIERFHTYAGQDQGRHGYYDNLQGIPLPNPRNLESFNGIIGARNAIAASVAFLGDYVRNVAWNDLQGYLIETIFKIDPVDLNNTADLQIDQGIGGRSLPVSPHTLRASDFEYDKSMQQKLADLDSRHTPFLEAGAPAGFVQSSSRILKQLSSRHAVVCYLFTLSLLIAAVVATLITLRVTRWA